MLPQERSEDSVCLWGNKRGRDVDQEDSTLAKTVLELLNVFCYHFTTELQREASTEQAESLLGALD